MPSVGQLMCVGSDHSTWNSGVNRAQGHDGAAILTFPMPVFIDLMMDDPDKDWGNPLYPAIV